MKNTLTLLVLLFAPFYSFSQTEADTVQWNQLEDRDDVFYRKGLDKPFTGVVVKFNEKWKLRYIHTMINGKKEGLSTIWDESGKKAGELNYINGKREGLNTEWHESGEKSSEVNFVNGKKEGLMTSWYQNGQKKSEFNFVNDKIVSIKKWDKDGNEIKD